MNFNSVRDCVFCSILDIISCVGFKRSHPAHESVLDYNWCNLMWTAAEVAEASSTSSNVLHFLRFNLMKFFITRGGKGEWKIKKEANEGFSAIDTHANSRRGEIRVDSGERKFLFGTIKPTQNRLLFTCLPPSFFPLLPLIQLLSEIKVARARATAHALFFFWFYFFCRDRKCISKQKIAQSEVTYPKKL